MNDFDGFDRDPGPDEEPKEISECDGCGEEREIVDEDMGHCQECSDDYAQACADSRAESRAERRAMACDLGIGPSDNWND